MIIKKVTKKIRDREERCEHGLKTVKSALTTSSSQRHFGGIKTCIREERFFFKIEFALLYQ